jgi:GT2 family glycosyltransferase
MKTIAVLLTVFNRKEKTLACLHNLFLQALPKGFVLDVFLVNDGCTDDTPEAVKVQFPSVNIINSNGNLFWNRGMHLAWQTAAKTKEYEFYLWLNDDTYLYPNAIQSLYDIIKSHIMDVVAIGATTSAFNKNITTYGGRNWKTILPVTGKEYDCKEFNGNCVLVSKKVFNKVGNLDYTFSHSYGDIEYGLRLEKHNIRKIVAPLHIGTCEPNEGVKKCFDTKFSLFSRFRHFYAPLGMNPNEFFYMNNKYFGLFKALKVYIATHLRVIIPSLWK